MSSEALRFEALLAVGAVCGCIGAMASTVSSRISAPGSERVILRFESAPHGAVLDV